MAGLVAGQRLDHLAQGAEGEVDALALGEGDAGVVADAWGKKENALKSR